MGNRPVTLCTCQMINNTLIVLACVLVVGIFIWVFDAIGGVVVNGIITLVKG